MATLNFNKYRVITAKYSRKQEVVKGSIAKLQPTLTASTRVNKQNNNALIDLKITLGENLPFTLEVELEGDFTYKLDSDKENYGSEFKKFISINAVTILYPYLRTIVSSLSGMSNEFSQIILPTINVAKDVEIRMDD